jgi:hypothetical protein
VGRIHRQSARARRAVSSRLAGAAWLAPPGRCAGRSVNRALTWWPDNADGSHPGRCHRGGWRSRSRAGTLVATCDRVRRTRLAPRRLSSSPASRSSSLVCRNSFTNIGCIVPSSNRSESLGCARPSRRPAHQGRYRPRSGRTLSRRRVNKCRRRCGTGRTGAQGKAEVAIPPVACGPSTAAIS